MPSFVVRLSTSEGHATNEAPFAQQVEMEAAMTKPVITRRTKQGVQDVPALLKLLKIAPDQRSIADLTAIATQIRYTGIFESLYISPDQEAALCRILNMRKFLTKGATVVHEGTSTGSFYMVVEGTLVVLASRQLALAPTVTPQEEKFVLVANIIEALSLAAADKSGTSDPFVTVTCGTQMVESEVKKQTTNPIWDETLRIFNVDVDEEFVEIAVWDHDTWGDSDFLGIAKVPLAPLMENLHTVQNCAIKLEEDARYQASADEAGVDYSISGTISFHLQLTTEAVLAQIEQLESSAHKAGKDKTYYTAGDKFGIEQVMAGNCKAPNSVIVEQSTQVLRVTAEEYMAQVVPLQADEIDRKKEFFKELSIFGNCAPEELENMSKWFRVSKYKPGDSIALEGGDREEVVFVMSGEVSVVVDVPEPHVKKHAVFANHLGGQGLPPLARHKK